MCYRDHRQRQNHFNYFDAWISHFSLDFLHFFFLAFLFIFIPISFVFVKISFICSFYNVIKIIFLLNFSNFIYLFLISSLNVILKLHNAHAYLLGICNPRICFIWGISCCVCVFSEGVCELNKSSSDVLIRYFVLMIWINSVKFEWNDCCFEELLLCW